MQSTIINNYLLTINCQEGAGSYWRIAASWPNLAFVLGFICLGGIHNLEIEPSIRVIAKDKVAIKARQVSIKSYRKRKCYWIWIPFSFPPSVSPSLVHCTWPIWLPTWHWRMATSPSVTSVSLGVVRKCCLWHSAKP